MKLFLSLLTFAAILLTKPSYSQQPYDIHLSWNSAKAHATENSIVIAWSADNAAKGVVKYGLDKNLSDSQHTTPQLSESAKIYVHKATLTHLKSNTVYYYKCGSDEAWSKTYTFKTAPVLGDQQKFAVGVWGDTQDNEFNTKFEKTDTIAQQLLKYPLRFTIHMGDIVNNGSVVPSWIRLFNVIQPVNATLPFMPVTGNHDVDNSDKDPGYQKPFPIFYDFLNLPDNKTDYSYNYGNTHFVAISTGHAKGVEEAHRTDWRYGKDSPEYEWLEKDLAKARSNKKITWIIVYMHHPAYSYGWSHVQGWQDHITPLLDKYNVDLALAGHRHVYERHKAIRNNEIQPQEDTHVYNKAAGTVYITNGTAGGSPQGLGGKAMPSMIFTSDSKMYNYAIMCIEGRKLTYHVYDQKGQKIDYFEMNK
jgi:predicted MPP superfamily phosphohydrolase